MGDTPPFPVQLDLSSDIQAGVAVVGNGYSSKTNRNAAGHAACLRVVRYKFNETTNRRSSRRLFKNGRACIEQSAGNLERFKRAAGGCKKAESNVSAGVSMTALCIPVKSVYTA
ncbi:hypothetical protein GA0061102_104439 [Rhizobium miluonense]|uniref:Uncharacterized protein n=1 Tax=Rhizobium miluonense TaxID=411945 RepID=A0A1C3WXD9_9HYPH|nr:hypothetical protein GA0061102_104439 [Rhizobium miluonense]